MSLYAQLRATATKLIAEYGDPISLIKIVQNTYNPSTGRAVEADRYPLTGVAIIDSAKPGAKLDESFKIVAGDLILTVAQGALTVDIEPRDEILIGSDRWRVIAVDPPHSQDSVVVRTVQLRRGDS